MFSSPLAATEGIPKTVAATYRTPACWCNSESSLESAGEIVAIITCTQPVFAEANGLPSTMTLRTASSSESMVMTASFWKASRTEESTDTPSSFFASSAFRFHTATS